MHLHHDLSFLGRGFDYHNLFIIMGDRISSDVMMLTSSSLIRHRTRRLSGVGKDNRPLRSLG
jgi:hypothetical protein